MNRSPGGLVAVRLPLDPGPTIDPFALAGPDGILFHTGAVSYTHLTLPTILRV